ncbi:MAG: DUF983 domain-containing protein [Alphaproteobacteria bacterium]|nr:DUF983 domain-containing protein [Alphaproteobacteria bacterium]
MTATSEDSPLQFGGTSDRPLGESLKRGWKGKCPRCGKGHVFYRYLKVRDECEVCGLELHHHQADDAPPYFTILIVGHVIVALMIVYERAFLPPLWHQMVIGVFGTLALSLTLLPRIKGALVAFQWSRRMHGFGEATGVPFADD